MKLLKIVKVPEAKIEFTPEDIKALVDGATCHYDYKCNQMAAQGGLIYGLLNRSEGPRGQQFNVELCVQWQKRGGCNHHTAGACVKGLVCLWDNCLRKPRKTFFGSSDFVFMF